MRDGAIAYDELVAAADLPIGWTDEQDQGTYRLKRRDDQARFGYAVERHSWKQFLHPRVLRLWRARRQERGFEVMAAPEAAPKYAFIGVRACELHAIAIQDKVFMHGPHIDLSYQTRRQEVFIVAVNCAQAGGTCFCVSMGTGPKATVGFDLALTEVLHGEQHYFVIEVGTALGAEMLGNVPHRPASADARQAAEGVVAHTATQMGRTLDTTDIKALLYRNYEHPQWDDVAARCLTCANSTMVCPTCLCTTVEDVTDLTGEQAERWRTWDSCVTIDYSYIHGGSVRASPKSRYRLWLTHKLATWIEQSRRCHDRRGEGEAQWPCRRLNCSWRSILSSQGLSLVTCH